METTIILGLYRDYRVYIGVILGLGVRGQGLGFRV